MELYRVLLVDDEEDIRVGISRKMDWASLGFALVGEAENGRTPWSWRKRWSRTWCSRTSRCPSWTGWSCADPVGAAAGVQVRGLFRL